MKKTLVISDNHSPYMHPDALEFISDILGLHPDIERVIHAGDLIDAHAFSRHEIDPSLLGPKCEIKEAKKQIQELESIIGKREKEIRFS